MSENAEKYLELSKLVKRLDDQIDSLNDQVYDCLNEMDRIWNDISPSEIVELQLLLKANGLPKVSRPTLEEFEQAELRLNKSLKELGK
mgnify:CR=1 FL=1